MKYFIIGMHGSGKQEVADNLESLGVSCGRQFSNLDERSPYIYNCDNYELYTVEDINEMFENNAYVFMREFPMPEGNFGAWKYYEGLSLYELENNDVFILSPDQLFNINPTAIKDEVCFIWLDNTKQDRLNRYYAEKRTYSFSSREDIERKDSQSFVNLLYKFDKSRVLYFTNEDPARVTAIIYSLVKYPDLLSVYSESFN